MEIVHALRRSFRSRSRMDENQGKTSGVWGVSVAAHARGSQSHISPPVWDISRCLYPSPQSSNETDEYPVTVHHDLRLKFTRESQHLARFYLFWHQFTIFVWLFLEEHHSFNGFCFRSRAVRRRSDQSLIPVFSEYKSSCSFEQWTVRPSTASSLPENLRPQPGEKGGRDWDPCQHTAPP